MHISAGGREGQRHQIPLELEFQAAMSFSYRCYEPNSGPVQERYHACSSSYNNLSTPHSWYLDWNYWSCLVISISVSVLQLIKHRVINVIGKVGPIWKQQNTLHSFLPIPKWGIVHREKQNKRKLVTKYAL